GRARDLHSFPTRRSSDLALVVLHHVGELVEVVALLLEVDAEVLEAIDVGVEAGVLGVGDEADAVDALEDQLTAGVEEDLTGDGVDRKSTRLNSSHVKISY